MASLAVFICYLCRQVYILSPQHFCQPECDKMTAFHWDFCPKCKRVMNSDMEAQLAQSDVDDSA